MTFKPYILCPHCGGSAFIFGPRGGLSVNVLCANEACRHWFNFKGPFGMDDLNKIEPEGSPVWSVLEHILDILPDEWDRDKDFSLRREMLCKNPPRCPECNDEQVQIMNVFVSPAEWRCRTCKHEFQFEPSEPKQ